MEVFQKTTYKELEQRVKELEREASNHSSSLLRLQRLISTGPAVYYTCRVTNDYAATFVSENIKEQLGYTPQDFIEDPNFWVDHIHPEDKESTIERYAKALSHLSQKDILSHEYRFLAKDGSYRWMHDQSKVIFDDEGNPVELVGVWVDVSQRKATDEKLQKARVEEETLRRHQLKAQVENQALEIAQKHKDLTIFAHAVEGAIDSIIITQLNGHIIYANKATEGLYGYKKGEMKGLPVKTLNPLPEMVEEMISTMIETGSWSGEVSQQRKNKTIFPALLSLSTVYNSAGEPVALMGAVRDLTEQKRAEKEKEKLEIKLQQAQKMEAIGLLAGGVAHDLNNILAAITGYPDILLLQLPEESKLRKPIEAIKDAGKRSSIVVADLLTIARGVASVRTISNLNTLVAEYLNSPEHKHLDSLYPQIQYHQLLTDDLLTISCSPVHVKKCIMNLVTNAAESIDTSGSVTLRTSIITPDLQWIRENNLKQQKYAVLMVTDTGTGIPKKDIEHIFEPFYTKKVMGRSGTGLGLTVVWNTVSEHGGTVTVMSCDQGTSFKLFFPLSGESVNESLSREEELCIGNGEKILVVDDEPQLLDLAEHMLSILGYDVICLNSGEKAIAYLQDYQVDLVVIDMVMEPGMNGRQTYEQIIKLHPGQKAIITSGFVESNDVKAIFQLGAGLFVKKPYSINQLSKAVKDALNK